MKDKQLKLYKKYFEKQRICNICKGYHKHFDIKYLVIFAYNGDENKSFKLACLGNCPYCKNVSIKFSLPMSQEEAYILKSKMEKLKENKY